MLSAQLCQFPTFPWVHRSQNWIIHLGGLRTTKRFRVSSYVNEVGGRNVATLFFVQICTFLVICVVLLHWLISKSSFKVHRQRRWLNLTGIPLGSPLGHKWIMGTNSPSYALCLAWKYICNTGWTTCLGHPVWCHTSSDSFAALLTANDPLYIFFYRFTC